MIAGWDACPRREARRTEPRQPVDVSRTPVREAIRALLAIGLVEFHGRQGTRVATMSIPKLVEMFDHMAALEGAMRQLCGAAGIGRGPGGVERPSGESLSAPSRRNSRKYLTSSKHGVSTDYESIAPGRGAPDLQAGNGPSCAAVLHRSRMQVTYQPAACTRLSKSTSESVSPSSDGRRRGGAGPATRSCALVGGSTSPDFIAIDCRPPTSSSRR